VEPFEKIPCSIFAAFVSQTFFIAEKNNLKGGLIYFGSRFQRDFNPSQYRGHMAEYISPHLGSQETEREREREREYLHTYMLTLLAGYLLFPLFISPIHSATRWCHPHSGVSLLFILSWKPIHRGDNY
jgi:hypothetical protein